MRRRPIAFALGTIAGLIVLAAAGALIVASTGAYDFAATAPHTGLTHWVMHTAMERSVAARADEVPAPPKLDSAMVQRGFEEYHEMCVACHGAPGVERGPLGKGINPRPPELAKHAAEWSDRELFWITKHGIKLAGMPAFGVTHSDEELWGIVAFLRRLQYLSPDEYQRLAMAAESHEHGATHGATTRASAGEVAMDHQGAGQAHPSEAAPRAADHATSHPATAASEHATMRGTRQTGAHAEAHSAPSDSETTEKLEALAAGLVEDSTVAARVRADSALRRLWESDRVRRQLAKPKQKR